MPTPVTSSIMGRSECTGIAVFGATGSVGESALDVARHFGSRLRIRGLSAHTRFDRLVELAAEFRPAWIVASDSEKAESFHWPALPGTELLLGEQGLLAGAVDSEIKTLLVAIVGIAGLPGTMAALRAGKNVALANKEALVAAGPLVMQAAQEAGSAVLPIDSEHNAIFQCLQGAKAAEVARLVLTASGGPFRTWSAARMESATPAEALAHPNWDMGRKISIDSATMMNKALEIIEAKWLFGLDAGRIEVVVHPQSIVHSMVEFVDGSVLAQMSPPDMRLPVQHALLYPDRFAGPADRMDFAQHVSLEFFPPDFARFPALILGMEVANRGGTSGAVLNAANEVAVEAFLRGDIGFCDIVRVASDILERHPFQATPDIAQIIAIDRWAREEAEKWILV
jgi:1-deoxy-D-xylulose-5-phosphate reductoisomerase